MFSKFLFCAIGGACIFYGIMRRDEANKRYSRCVNSMAENNLIS